jgi:hypothetical protein
MERREEERRRERERDQVRNLRDVGHLQCTVPHQEVSSSVGLQCGESHHPAHQPPKLIIIHSRIRLEKFERREQ